MTTELDSNYILTKDFLPEELVTIMEIARKSLQNSEWSEELGDMLDIKDKELDDLYCRLTRALTAAEETT